MTGTRKLGLVALMFAVALGLVGLAAATHKAYPLFFVWLPLIAVPWILASMEPGAGQTTGPEASSPEETNSRPETEHS